MESDESRIGLLGKIFQLLGRLFTELAPIFRFVVMTVASVPPVIEIGYNETVNIELGMLSPKTNDFEHWERENTLFAQRFLTFAIIDFPEGISSDYWFIYFQPKNLKVDVGSTLKTNVSITLTRPPISKNSVQSGILKFRIYDTIAYGNLWTPPKGSPLDKFPNRGMWFINAAFLMRFGKYSGIVDTTSKDVDVLVKVKPYHDLKFETIPLKTLKPDQIESIPITLENRGNYNDTFNFRAIGKNIDIKISNPPAVTLAPGERKDISLGVSVYPSIFDYGTFHEIKIQAYSIYEPNVIIAEDSVHIETKGVYISEMGGIGVIFLIFIVFLFSAFVIYRRRIFFEKYCKKPDKPWIIPEEKKYLEKIKEKDINEYDKTLEMMKEEYNSAMLWYKDYCKNITAPTPKKPEKEKRKKKSKLKFDNFFNSIKKKVKPKKKAKKDKQKEKKIKKKPVEKKPEPIISEKTEKELLIERKEIAEKRKREIIISRIKRQESKQKKKRGGIELGE